MQVGIVSLFPQMFSALEYGMVGRAQQKGLLQLSYFNPREYVDSNYRSVDDRPYGGGPGMVLQVEPMLSAINNAKQLLGADTLVIMLSPQGKKVSYLDFKFLAMRERVILVSGRYEGVDERLIGIAIDEEWSIGDYVLTGGELAVMVIIDGTARLLPGVLGHEDSAVNDSFSVGLLDYPHYTRPHDFLGYRVPKVLLSGDHRAISVWRRRQQILRTYKRRPDLIQDLLQMQQITMQEIDEAIKLGDEE